MLNNIEVRLSGTGGQGIILSGIILAEAAVLDGKEVVQTQSYGPEARGGASKAEVIISQAPILYPKVIKPRYLLLMSQEAARLYASNVAKDGLVVVDSTVVENMPESPARVMQIPITQLAGEQVGSPLTANILAIGALASAAGLVTYESMVEALRLRLPRVININGKALKLGWEWGQRYDC